MQTEEYTIVSIRPINQYMSMGFQLSRLQEQRLRKVQYGH